MPPHPWRPSRTIPIVRPDVDRYAKQAKASWEAHPLRSDEQITSFVCELSARVPERARQAFTSCLRRLLLIEAFCPPAFSDTANPETLKNDLKAMSFGRFKAAKRALTEAAQLIAGSIPQTDGIPIAPVPLASVMTYAHLVMQKVTFCLQNATVEATGQVVFPLLREALLENARDKNGKLVNPLDRIKEPAENVAGMHFKGTPFLDLFAMPAALRMPTEKRFEHTLVLGKSGRGKTHLLQSVIHADLMSENPPAIVVIEPKGDMTRALGKLEIFKRHPERLLIIDAALSPPLNMFKLPTEAVGEMIKQYAYILGGIDGESRNQSSALSHVARLVIARGKGLQDFIDILLDPARKIDDSDFGKDMLRYGNDRSRAFFKGVFYGHYFVHSRQSLAGKVLDLIDESDEFADMFCAEENVANMFERIETPGTLTLVNTAQGTLPRSVSSVMGRWFIGQTIAAALRRGPQLERHRKPAYLVVDEAHDYFDSNLSQMLVRIRSYRLGITLTTNSLKDAREAGIEDALLGKTEIKIVSPSSTDANDIAAHAGRADAAFYSSLRQEKGIYSEFAYYDGTQGPARIRTFPFKAPQISDKEFDEMRERFRGTRHQPDTSVPQSDPINEPAIAATPQQPPKIDPKIDPDIDRVAPSSAPNKGPRRPGKRSKP